MSGALPTAAENFSIIRGGPFHRVLELIGPANNERQRVINRALVAVLICWLPLLVLSFVQGIAFDSNVAIPFLRDYAVHLRFLVALPILILSETPIDRRWRDLAQEFLRTGLITTAEAPSFDRLMLRIARLRDFPLPEIIMLALAYVPPLFLGNAALPLNKFSSWHTVGISSPQTTMAGWWFWLVSAPLFRFLLLRWIWRMFLWTLFLWRTSRLKLYLVATHTDLAAGLGFLSEGQRAYAPIVFAGGVVIGGAVLNAVRYEGQTLSSLKTPMIAYGVSVLSRSGRRATHDSRNRLDNAGRRNCPRRPQNVGLIHGIGTLSI